MTDAPANPPRPTYQTGQLLTVADFEDEQAFHRAMAEAATRRLFAAGVLGGLEVSVVTPTGVAETPGQARPIGLRISPGAAYDDEGRLLLLADRAQTAGAPLLAGPDGLVLRLDTAAAYRPGESLRQILSIAFGETALNETRVATAPVLTLDEAEAGVALATVTITAPPTTAGKASPSSFDLQVSIDLSKVRPARLLAARLPPIPAEGLSGVLDPARLPRIPASLIDGLPPPDGGPVEASRLVGMVALDRLPRIPAGMIDGLPDPEAGPVAAERLVGMIDPARLPRIPAALIDGLPDPAALPISAERIVGPITADQVPALADILRRLERLEAAGKSTDPPQPPAPPTTAGLGAFAGTYQTAAGPYADRFDPLIVSADDKVTLAGVALPAAFDAASRHMTWAWTSSAPDATEGEITFSPGAPPSFTGTITLGPGGLWVPPGAPELPGSLGPLPGKAGALLPGARRFPFVSVGFTPPQPPFAAHLDLADQTPRADNLSFEPGPEACYNTAYGGWMLTRSGGAGLQVRFGLAAPPTQDLHLSLVHCTSSKWPADGFAPVDITLNGEMIAADFDPARAHANTGVDTRNYVQDSFLLAARLIRPGSNSLQITLRPEAETRYWIRVLNITA